ncbi:TonB-dependent receptor [Ohtaekwangia koreensis]|uniref:Outer membrane receptor for ferrienterochelin and colicins n=1 Tax=Ohtaekwangia koreensis TaxID=688867 RepID=A0A1T5MFJ1_9BACT|nr:TonB-dependent receptor [Ohtaekwangia koreensis]SKC87000.1 outer membrane receptor for ferrienterochelin and colicins [Ohtaekwangia koreensis]
MNYLFILIFTFSSLLSIAQTGTISGTVVTGGQPLEFANVVIRNTSLGSITRQNGSFTIGNVPYGTYTISISAIGYESKTKQVIVSAQEAVVLHITLAESTSALEEVVISGTMKEVSRLESPVPVEVYSSAFFKANPTPSLFESLQNVNGVRPQLNCNVCNTGDIHINGLEGPYTMILIDGMPIVSGLSTVYGLTGIPQSLIERMEIVKGPASTLYGSEAVGGLINIITKKPSAAPAVSVDMFGTSWGEVNTDIGFKVKAGNVAESLIGINYFNYQQPADHNGDGFTDVTLQNRISIFNKWSFNREDNRIFTLAGRYNYEDRWGGDMRWKKIYRGGEEIYGESIYTSRWEMFGLYQLPVKELINFQFSTNGHRQNSFYGATSYNADQYIGFGQLTWSKHAGTRHDLLLGAAYRYTFYDDNTPATASIEGNNKASGTHLPGLFVQDEIMINADNKLLLGIRYDYNSLHGNIVSPRANYKWSSPNKKNVVRLSVGNGYRVANVFTEDHAALTGARQVIFSESLQPETSWNGNVNLVKKIYTGNNTFIGLDASAFYTYFNNRIIPDYETDPNKIIYSNLDGSAVSKGVSLNVDVSWENGLKVLGGGTLMDVSITENGVTSRQLLTERFSGVWSIGYIFNASGFSIDYTGNVYGPMRLPLLGNLDNRAAYSPWWSIQNIQITKQFDKGWEIYGGIKNLLNYTPPSNSIARSFDPFDKNVQFDDHGQVVATPDNPYALTFDPSYVFAPNQGIRGFLGVRYTVNR